MSRLSQLAVCVTLLIVSSQECRADWSDSVFPIKNHSFGTVAVGAKTEFTFPIYNTTGRDMHIREVRASCGCTTPILSGNDIPAGSQGSLVARFNTPTFRGKKGATLTVVITKPFFAEVQLRVDGYIRSDMVFHPGSIEMGTLNQGEPKVGQTKLYYAGRSDWQVVDMRSNSPWLVPTFKQIERGTGKATYDLSVQVREDAPQGFFQDEIIVQTNDRSMPRVPLRVSGTVVSVLSISPQSIALGTVQPNQSLVQRLVLTGREPFGIESIECEGWNVTFENPNAVKKMHMLNITLTPGNARGTQRTPVIIKTSGNQPATAKAILTAEVLGNQVAVAP